MEVTQKWINEDGIFFPIPGNTVLHQTPGKGIFQLYQSKNPSDKRLGLVKISDKFEFDFKVYELGYKDTIDQICMVWNSDLYVDSNKNLGVIFNGLKGTSKTISAKQLCNQLDIPVIVIPDNIDGMVEFLQSLCFECVVFIDEAEKTFKKGEDDEVLVKLIDGVYNKTRKLYILTTNRLDVNENLLGRPGRIRYIKQFGNLNEEAVREYVKDNLIDQSKVDHVIQIVDLLEISTIDILKCIVEEVNIVGEISENSSLNIPKARYVFDVLEFSSDFSDQKITELCDFLSTCPDGKSVFDWLDDPCTVEVSEGKVYEGDNRSYIYDTWQGYLEKIAAPFSSIWKGCELTGGVVLDDVDRNGFFKVKDRWGDEVLYKILRRRDAPSLYKGNLVY